MSITSADNSVLSAVQRRCQLALMLCLPAPPLSCEAVCQFNRVGLSVTLQDIADVNHSLQRCFILKITLSRAQDKLQLIGSPLSRHLCLLHHLRLAIRLSPLFVQDYFSPALRQLLQEKQTDRALYDDHNLSTLTELMAQQLQRTFSRHDRQLICLWLQYSFLAQEHRVFSDRQLHWLEQKPEYALAREIIRYRAKRGFPCNDTDQAALLVLALNQLYIPHTAKLTCESEQQLLTAVTRLMQRFLALCGETYHFSVESGLRERLYSHMAQALDRSYLQTDTESAIAGEVAHNYPRLLRTTVAALTEFERQYDVQFSDEELGLTTIIFGAWLIRGHTLHEKHVLLLTSNNPQLEEQLELQIRELTLLPLHIKRLDVQTFQQQGAPKGISMVVTPYTIQLPLFSPPLIHVTLPLDKQQRQSIRALLETVVVN